MYIFAKKIIMDTLNVSFDNLYKKLNNPSQSIVDEVIVLDREILTSKQLLNPETTPSVRLEDTLVFFLCKYGKVSISVNYETYQLSKGSLITLSPFHVISNIRVDNNCEVTAVYIARNLAISCIRDTPIAKKMMTTMDKRTHPSPVMQLKDDEMRELVEIIMRIKKYLNMPDHTFQTQKVRNETCNFLLELAHILLQRSGSENKKDEKESRKHEITRDFVKMLTQNFREQHEVAFYASKLAVTPDHLSRTVTTATGKSPIQLINGVLIIEAKILLRKPDATIKQVADELNFGDQSSFGKFFKRLTGMTPVEYKNGGKKGK
jgi:AraC-like DNA-binding protein